ncbi:MAG: hypothetical protein EOP85_22070 [Verrucomicrobiaceae bacterium]|nr:MAG: hypothetical protein EOP85_22070 [Verrucomicrobiaceae bacterium]
MDFPPEKSRTGRARSLPSSRPFTLAVVLSAVHYLAIITTVTAFLLFFREQSQLAVKLIVGGIVTSVFTWLIAFFKRREAHCPLCKGTPLINSGARAHARASRLYPFNHGVSASFSIIATQTFRCMYCGCDFDLLKTPSHLREKYYTDTVE